MPQIPVADAPFWASEGGGKNFFWQEEARAKKKKNPKTVLAKEKKSASFGPENHFFGRTKPRPTFLAPKSHVGSPKPPFFGNPCCPPPPSPSPLYLDAEVHVGVAGEGDGDEVPLGLELELQFHGPVAVLPPDPARS